MTTQHTTLTDRERWHRTLAIGWARYNGQKGTDKQLYRIMRQLGVEDLERMLGERGYIIAHAERR